MQPGLRDIWKQLQEDSPESGRQPLSMSCLHCLCTSVSFLLLCRLPLAHILHHGGWLPGAIEYVFGTAA